MRLSVCCRSFLNGTARVARPERASSARLGIGTHLSCEAAWERCSASLAPSPNLLPRGGEERLNRCDPPSPPLGERVGVRGLKSAGVMPRTSLTTYMDTRMDSRSSKRSHLLFAV